MTEKNFILASGSVPRRQLLEQIGYTPKLVDPADIDETTGKYETPTAYVKRMAVEKASAVAAPPPRRNHSGLRYGRCFPATK